MSDNRSGLFLVDRGIFDHPAFNPDEPFSEREAFLWMVAEAAFKPRQVRTKRSGIVSVAKGQLTSSTRFMATRFKWSEARVRRFVQRLADCQTIDANSDAGQLVITICNYDVYQDFRRYRDAVGDAQASAGFDAVGDAGGDAQKNEQATRLRRGSDADATQTRTPSTPDIYTHNLHTPARAESVSDPPPDPKPDPDPPLVTDAEIMPFELSPADVERAKAPPLTIDADEPPEMPQFLKRVSREKVIANVGRVRMVGPKNAEAYVDAWEARGVTLEQIDELAIDAMNFGGGCRDWMVSEIGKLTGAQSDERISATTLDAFPELRDHAS